MTALAVGGVLYYLARTGRLPARTDTAHSASAGEKPSAHMLALEPMLVNLADPDGTSYMRVVLSLRVLVAGEKKEEKADSEKTDGELVAPVRDVVLSVLGQQTSEGLLAADGKEHLKAELKSELAKRYPELKVTDVFFTDYLVQR